MEKKSGKNKFLELIGGELQKCSKCGACRTICPVFAENQREKYSARGKIALSDAVAQGVLPLTDEYYDILNNCILCLSCVENCSSGVKVDKIIRAARALLVEQRGLPLPQRIIHKMLQHGKEFMDLILKKGSLFQYIFFKSIPKTSGLRSRFPMPLIDKTRYIPTLVRKPFRKRVTERVEAAVPKKSVVFFTGCCTNYIYPNIGEAVVKVLNELGISVIIPKGQMCCGAPAETAGDLHTVIELAQNNINELLFEEEKYKVVLPCSSGGYMFKHIYPELFQNDAKIMSQAKKLALLTCDISEYLVKEVGLDKIAGHIKQAFTKKITYHDPCHLNRGQGIKTEPRKLLKILSGESFVEMDEADRCCGSGGVYGIKHRSISNKILSRKIDSIKNSEAEIVATGCPGCIIQLLDGINQKDLNIRVLHTVEALAECI